MGSDFRLFDAMAFDAQPMHGEPVAWRDTTSSPVPCLVPGVGIRTELMASRTVGVTHVTVRDTGVSLFCETVDDLGSVTLEARGRGGPRLGHPGLFVASFTRRVGAEDIHVILVVEGVGAPVHVGMTHGARRAAIQSQIAVVASST